jgi:hypothetical protein
MRDTARGSSYRRCGSRPRSAPPAHRLMASLDPESHRDAEQAWLQEAERRRSADARRRRYPLGLSRPGDPVAEPLPRHTSKSLADVRPLLVHRLRVPPFRSADTRQL